MLRLNLSLALMLTLSTAAAAAGAGEAAQARSKSQEDAVSEQNGIKVEVEHSLAGANLIVRYVVTNLSKQPVLVFDRMWDNTADRLAAQWGYMDLEKDTAIASRILVPMPRSVTMEDPPEPYGHELAPGQRTTGTLSFEIPLKTVGPYDFLKKRIARSPVNLKKLQFKVGWAPKADFGEILGALEPVTEQGETLWPVRFWDIEKRQKIARSPAIPVKLSGLAP